MKKLTLQVQISVDGFIAGPNGEMDWLTWDMDDKLKDHITNLTDSTDTILLGRKMAGGFIDYWANVLTNPNDPQVDFARKMVNAHKVVFSRTLEKSEWANTEIAKGKLADEISRLKKLPGKDIIVYGGANFVSHLIEKGLVDELQLFVNPTAVGNGLRIFNGLTKLELKESLPFSCGIVVMKYKPARV